ncbi:MAG: pyridoxamine 5'-phosphate oxidase family protein [Nostocoides sp.]
MSIDPAIGALASTGANFAILSVHLPNDQIASHVMWVDADEEHLLINTEVHRAKFKAIQADPHVTVTVMDASNPYAYAEVRGQVTGTVRGEEARAHIDALSRRYTGADYANPVESERVILQITPDRQRPNGI